MDTKYTSDSCSVAKTTWEQGRLSSGSDRVAAECAVAMVYNGISHVVMMATPSHLQDFALGFSLSEGILQNPKQLLDVEVTNHEQGIELCLTITAKPFETLKNRRRNLTGNTGCGLCGAESLAQAIPEPKEVTRDIRVSHQALQKAIGTLEKKQSLQQLTGAVHAAAWCDIDGEIIQLREDVGRHNALDKLLGALAQCNSSGEGFVLITSRASYEMVAKAASANIAILAAVSAPTCLAIAQAQRSGLTLVGFTRPGRQIVYTRPERLSEP